MSKYLAEQISEVVVNTHFEDLPQYAVDKAKMLTLDVLASMVGTRKVISSEIARSGRARRPGRGFHRRLRQEGCSTQRCIRKCYPVLWS